MKNETPRHEMDRTAGHSLYGKGVRARSWPYGVGSVGPGDRAVEGRTTREGGRRARSNLSACARLKAEPLKCTSNSTCYDSSSEERDEGAGGRVDVDIVCISYRVISSMFNVHA